MLFLLSIMAQISISKRKFSVSDPEEAFETFLYAYDKIDFFITSLSDSNPSNISRAKLIISPLIKVLFSAYHSHFQCPSYRGKLISNCSPYLISILKRLLFLRKGNDEEFIQNNVTSILSGILLVMKSLCSSGVQENDLCNETLKNFAYAILI